MCYHTHTWLIHVLPHTHMTHSCFTTHTRTCFVRFVCQVKPKDPWLSYMVTHTLSLQKNDFYCQSTTHTLCVHSQSVCVCVCACACLVQSKEPWLVHTSAKAHSLCPKAESRLAKYDAHTLSLSLSLSLSLPLSLRIPHPLAMCVCVCVWLVKSKEPWLVHVLGESYSLSKSRI